MKYFASLLIVPFLSFLYQVSSSQTSNLGNVVVDEIQRHSIYESISGIIYNDSSCQALDLFPAQLRETFREHLALDPNKTKIDLYLIAQEQLKIKMKLLGIDECESGKKIYELFTKLINKKITPLDTASKASSSSNFALTSSFNINPIETNFDYSGSRSGPPSRTRRDSTESFGFNLTGEDLTFPMHSGDYENSLLDLDELFRRTYSNLSTEESEDSSYWKLAANQITSLIEPILKAADSVNDESTAGLIRYTINSVDYIKFAFLEHAKLAATKPTPFNIDTLANLLQSSMEAYFHLVDLENNAQVTDAVFGCIFDYVETLFNTVKMKKESYHPENIASAHSAKRAKTSDESYAPTVVDLDEVFDVPDFVQYEKRNSNTDDDDSKENTFVAGSTTAQESEGVQELDQDDNDNEDDDGYINIASADEVNKEENLQFFGSPLNQLFDLMSRGDTVKLNHVRSLYYGITEVDFEGVDESVLTNLQQIMDEALIKLFNEYQRH